MKLIATLLFSGLSLFSQQGLQIYRGSLVTAAEQIAGQIVLLPDNVVFLDEASPNFSFFSPKANVKSVSADGESVTIQLEKGVRDRAGETTRLIVRLNTLAEATAFQAWFGAAANAGAANAAASAEEMTFSAQRKKRLRSNTDGKLIIDSTRVIFESTDNASESRRWNLEDIRELKYRNAFEIEIRSFRGEKYVLMLAGSGMDNSQYKEIVDRITKARTSR